MLRSQEWARNPDSIELRFQRFFPGECDEAVSCGRVGAAASGWVSAEAVVEAARPARPAQVAMARPTVLASDALNAALLALKQNDFAALQEALAEDKDLAEIAADWDARADQAK